MMTQIPNNKSVALITGASRGIGYALAKRLARDGFHIIALARTVGALEELDDDIHSSGGTATLVPLDLSDMVGIDRLGHALFEKCGKLDIFVGNAAQLGCLSPLGHIEPKIWEQTLNINVTANWRLIRSLDPLLRASRASHVIFMTCHVARTSKSYWGSYATSKAALEALARIYAAEVATTQIKVNLFDPGPTRTAIRARAMPGENPDLLQKPSEVAEHLATLLTSTETRSGYLFSLRGGKIEAESLTMNTCPHGRTVPTFV